MIVDQGPFAETQSTALMEHEKQVDRITARACELDCEIPICVLDS